MSDFPNSPTSNQEFSIGNKTWYWDSTEETWRIKTTGTISAIPAQDASGQTGSFVFEDGGVLYRNVNFISDDEGIPLFGKYGEKAFDYGTANSSGGQTFDVNLNNGLLHYIDMTTGATSYTYNVSLTGYSSNTSSAIAIVVRGGENLTINWSNISWETSEGAPDFSAATAGTYSVLPLYNVVVGGNLGWLGGSRLEYSL